MECVECGSAAISERRERTAQGCCRFRCRDCRRQFNERSAGVLNRTQYPSDVIALVVLWRLRYRLTLHDLSEMFLERGVVFSHETVRDWEAKLTSILTTELRQRRRGKSGAGRRSWFVMSFGRRLAYESLRRTNPRSSSRYGDLGFGRPRSGLDRDVYRAPWAPVLVLSKIRQGVQWISQVAIWAVAWGFRRVEGERRR